MQSSLKNFDGRLRENVGEKGTPKKTPSVRNQILNANDQKNLKLKIAYNADEKMFKNKNYGSQS